jgi:V-type H+-transporting ATPase subunit E
MSTNSLELESKLIERIVEKRNLLLAEAERKAEVILRTGEEEIKRVQEETEKQLMTLIGSDLKAVHDRVVGRAELEGRKKVMLSRQEVIESVFQDASKKLREIAEGKGDDYGWVLQKLIQESTSLMGGEDFIVSANERDLEYLTTNLTKIKSELKKVISDAKVELDKTPINVMGGVIVRNTESTKTFNNTLEGRLESVKSRAQAEVAQMLGVI